MSGLIFIAPLRGYDEKAVSVGTQVHTGDRSFVQQHLREEVDVNTIVRRFGVTRSMPSGPTGGVYGDFTGILDYESAVEAVERAQAGFLALDPEVRERFQNDPGVYLRHVDALADDQLGPEVGGPAVEPQGQPRNADGTFAAVSPAEPGVP